MIRSMLLASAALLLAACGGGDEPAPDKPGQPYVDAVLRALHEYAQRLSREVRPILMREETDENSRAAVQAWAKSVDAFLADLESADPAGAPAALVRRVDDMRKDVRALRPLIHFDGFDRKLASQMSQKLGTRKRLFLNEARALGMRLQVVVDQ